MRHYDSGRWLDYLRTPLEGDRQQDMAAHLRSGCRDCGRTVDTLRRVAALAVADSESRPPEHAVRSAKTMFSLGQPECSRRPAGVAGLRAAFDSVLEPAAVGARSLDSSSRCLVYYADDYALTLRVDQSRNRVSEDLTLGGEIASRRGEPLSDIPAFLLSDHEVLAHAFSGSLGDFHLSCRMQRPLRLSLLVGDDQQLEVDLGRGIRRPANEPGSSVMGPPLAPPDASS